MYVRVINRQAALAVSRFRTAARRDIIPPTVRAYIANTDYEWYEFFLARPEIDEVNFWRPGGANFQALTPGEPLLFRLKAPYNAIAGAGFFVTFSLLPVSVAWDAFDLKNGVASELAMRGRIELYRRRMGTQIVTGEDARIGCVVLAEPIFLSRDDWIREPTDWHRNIVAGRTEDLTQGEGARIWDELMHRVRMAREESDPAARFGAERLVRPRLGQGAFRVLVTDSYDRRCALSGERTLPVLQAAHIKPYSLGGMHHVSNGMLFRSDLHMLFDRGYVTVTPDHRFEVSRRIRDEFENGRDYYAFEGRTIRLPNVESQHPDPDLLRWHNDNVFRG